MTTPAERLARRFHETYEQLAPQFGYATRRESAVPWEQVPEANRKLMTAVCEEIKQEQPDWQPIASALRDILRQLQTEAHEAGLMPALIRAECAYRKAAEVQFGEPDEPAVEETPAGNAAAPDQVCHLRWYEDGWVGAHVCYESGTHTEHRCGGCNATTEVAR